MDLNTVNSGFIEIVMLVGFSNASLVPIMYFTDITFSSFLCNTLMLCVLKQWSCLSRNYIEHKHQYKTHLYCRENCIPKIGIEIVLFINRIHHNHFRLHCVL